MATRFYLPSSGAADVNPNFDAGWEDTGSADRIKMILKNTTSTNTTALTNKTVLPPDTTPRDYLMRQYVSSPIPRPIHISGTFSAVLRCVEDANNNAFLAMVVRVLSNDGSTSRGTLYSSFSIGNEFSISNETRIVNAAAVTAVLAESGDRLVVEFGFTDAPAIAGNVTERFGNSATSDFALTAALTTDLNPWVEFSSDIFRSVIPGIGLRPAVFTPGRAR